MKQPAILYIITLTVTFFMSCGKDPTFSTTAPSTIQPSTSSTKTKIASSWFSPSFTIVSDRNSIFLVAQKDHESTVNYDGGSHIELAYVKLNYQGALTIKRLPSIFTCPANPSISNAQCEISFGLTQACCIVTIKNADRNISPSIIIGNPFPDMKVRYIVISRSLFNSLQINWDDYATVAVALNI